MFFNKNFCSNCLKGWVIKMKLNCWWLNQSLFFVEKSFFKLIVFTTAEERVLLTEHKDHQSRPPNLESCHYRFLFASAFHSKNIYHDFSKTFRFDTALMHHLPCRSNGGTLCHPLVHSFQPPKSHLQHFKNSETVFISFLKHENNLNKKSRELLQVFDPNFLIPHPGV